MKMNELNNTGKVFGIDLGTTYSCIAYIDENNKPVVVKNSEGELTTPSVVYFESREDITVGESAKESSKMYPDEVVSFIKRSMGKPNSNLKINGVEMSPAEISSYILKKVVNDAVDNLKIEGKLKDNETIKDVVITCPAYFGINERTATQTAGELAGLNVLQIINEPTAAAITYGVADDSVEKTVLVYDLGGGTFDITMIHIKPGEIKVICTGGDHNLGGKDWDDKILIYLDDEFGKQTGKKESVLDDPETLQELVLSTEKAKKLLTSKEKAPISINYMGERVRIELTREKFDSLTNDLLERTISLTEDIFKEASKKGYDKSSVSEILLVGGSSKMPQVTKRVKEAFGIPTRMFDPDESVAKGAALYADRKNEYNILLDEIAEKTGKTKEEIKIELDTSKSSINDLAEEANIDISEKKYLGAADDIKISNVSSRSFGTVAYNQKRELRLFNLIMKNDTLPKEATDTFFPSRGAQKNVNIQVLENLSSDKSIDPSLGQEVGAVKLDLPLGMDDKTPIEITFRLNEEGLLELKAVERKNNTFIEAKFETKEGLNEEEMSDAMQRVEDSSIN
ncbi:Hsp70 family protein [Thomasclavelia cocleata]|uniref:Hsp70 family protein n=1 Tax=Thomasclavelia cocleata TaxID=69824 RepID=UPI00256F269B|nr:Hsp70 family protein [Thomasclavelia cocleata]